MKKTIEVNLGGYAFVFNTDVYMEMREYLEQISLRLSEEEKEVITDIEHRLADIFNNELNISQQVVNIKMVKWAMITVGDVSEFGDPKFSGERKKYEAPPDNNPPVRKLYRNLSNAIIGGVCSGIADYYGMDLTKVRLIAVLLFLFAGVGFVPYLILWVIIPRKPIRSRFFKNAKFGNHEYR